MTSSPINSWQVDGEKVETVADFVSFSHEIKRYLFLGRKATTNLDSTLKSRDITLSKGCIVKAMVFPVIIYGWMWELGRKEGWAPKNWCFQVLVLNKTLESPLDSRGIKPINPKRNQPSTFIGRTDAKAETPILWPPDEENQLIEKVPDAEKDWRQEEKWVTEDEMVGWHHRLNGHEFWQTLGDSEG